MASAGDRPPCRHFNGTHGVIHGEPFIGSDDIAEDIAAT
jgi:hypothetical protein